MVEQRQPRRRFAKELIGCGLQKHGIDLTRNRIDLIGYAKEKNWISLISESEEQSGSGEQQMRTGLLAMISKSKEKTGISVTPIS